MKKVWIAIAGVIAALAAVLLVISLASPKETIESGDEDSSYPYSYEKTKDGLLIHVTGEFPEDSRWSIAGSSGTVTASEKKQNAKKADFLITPIGVGSGSVRLGLERDADGLSEQIYQITVELAVATDHEISVLRNYHSSTGVLAGKTDDDFSYRVASQSDGTIAVLLECAQEAEWSIEQDGEAVDVSYHNLFDGKYRFDIRYRSLGQSTLYLCRSGSTQAFTLHVTTTLDEQVQFISSAIVEHVYTEHMTQTELFDGFFGTFTLPSDAGKETRSMEEWVSRADNVTRLRVGCIRFSRDGADWALYLAKEGSTDDFVAGCAKISLEQSTLSVNEISVNNYLYEGGGAAAWTDAQGRRCMLKAENVTMEQLAEAAKEMIGVMTIG